jgi:hypothetical protein
MAFNSWLVGGVLAFLAGLFMRKKTQKLHQNVPEYTRTTVPDGEVVIDDPVAGVTPRPTHPPSPPLSSNTDDEIRSPG